MRNNIGSGFNRNVARSGNFLQISTCWIGFSWSFGLTNSVAPNFWAAENAHMHYMMSRDLNTLLPVLLRHWTALGEWWGKKHLKNTLKNHSSFWRSNGFLLEFMKWILAQLVSTSSQNKGTWRDWICTQGIFGWLYVNTNNPLRTCSLLSCFTSLWQPKLFVKGWWIWQAIRWLLLSNSNSELAVKQMVCLKVPKTCMISFYSHHRQWRWFYEEMNILQVRQFQVQR